MMLGPLSAPSSPPDTPTPRKWIPRSAQRGVAALGVAVVRVAAVDEDVALVEVRGDVVDHRVGRGAGLDHAHEHARARERADPLLGRLRGR